MVKGAALFVMILFFVGACDSSKSGVQITESLEPGTIMPVTIMIDGEKVPPEAIKKYIDKLSGSFSSESSTEDLKNLVEEFVRVEVLYREALNKGLDKKPEFLEELEDFKKRQLIRILIESELDGKVVVSDKEIEEYYRDNYELFVAGPEVKLSHILVGTEKEAMDIIKRLKGGEKFEELARIYSLDTQSAFRGGNIGYFTKEQLEPAFKSVALSLKTGEFSHEPVKTESGYHVLKVIDRKPSMLLKLSDVRGQIMEELLMQKQKEVLEKYLKDIKKKYKVKVKWKGVEGPILN